MIITTVETGLNSCARWLQSVRYTTMLSFIHKCTVDVDGDQL